MLDRDTILQKVSDVNDYVKQTRGYLHTIPEVAGQEFETTKFLQEEVKKLGLPIEMVSTTGFIATLDTGRPGKTVALRADIDGLPLQEDEENLTKKKLHISTNEGVCHACGHDGHAAMLLGAMKILYEVKDQLNGTILFCFEEGEEIWTGIYGMLDALAKKDVDMVYGTHLASFMKSGTISVEPGPRMAGAAEIEFEVIGKGGHGSRPDLSINPVFAAAQVLNGISSAWNNQINVTETVTLGITQIKGGSTYNIIPEKVYISGSLRFFNVAEGKKAFDVLSNVASLTAEAQLCKVDFLGHHRIAADPVVNDEHLANAVSKSLSEILPEGSLVTGVKWFASESFSLYAKKYPSVLAFVGIANEEVGSGAEHHNGKFDIDEDALQVGVTGAVTFAVENLTK